VVNGSWFVIEKMTKFVGSHLEFLKKQSTVNQFHEIHPPLPGACHAPGRLQQGLQ
jgi:hypothetical protein